MNETRNVDGTPPQKKGAAEKESVDSERFQKALRVEKSDEIDKREKRNRPKQQEELEDEVDDVGASIPVPQGVFKEYMKEDTKTSSVFDATEGTKSTLTSDSSNSPTSFKESYSGNLEEGQKSTISIGAPSPTSSDQESPPDDSDSSDLPSPTSDNSPPPISQPNVTTDSEMEFPSFEDQTPEIDQTTETGSSQAPEETKEPSTPEKTAQKKKVSAKKDTEKVLTTTAPPTAKQAAEKKAPTAPKQLDTKESSEKLGSTISDTVVKKKEPSPTEDKQDTKVVPLVVTREMGDSQKDSDNKGEDTVAAILPPLPAATGVPALAMSPFSNMPKDVFDVFEKMVGMMTVQKDSGKSVTTITLNMPNSVFNKSELVLEHYDTAPHSFNVQLFGSPEAIDRFAKNMRGLNQSITESKLAFSINLLPPKLSKNYVGRITSNDSTKEDREEKDGEESA